ncbi:MAG: FAD binding domain-containing protein, partial [Myxococcota bacterium]|nr:FAD binding domain-containing protein [Myxococcota bacterium]
MMHTDYSRPTQLDEACASLASQGNECALLAGGTDLIVRMRSRARQPKLLIDLKAIPEMQGIVPLEGGGWRINACVSMHELANHAALQAAYPAITMGAAAVGSLQIRQRATVGGNLANASPCMDTAPGIIVYDGQLRLRSVRGERLVPAASFFRSAGKNALEPDELLLAIELPPPGRKRSSFDKIKRTKGHDLALVNMAKL